MRLIASVLFGTAITLHVSRFGAPFDVTRLVRSMPALGLLLGISVFLALLLTNWLVIRLTAWEAGYRGLRLPVPVVTRALEYHAVHLLVPATLVLGLILAYVIVERRNADYAAELAVPYIYTLAATVIVGAIYLFSTYWSAMRNLMYAN